MEAEWMVDRARLRDLLREHPEMTQREMAETIGRSVSWVKKWMPRLRDAAPDDLAALRRKAVQPRGGPRLSQAVVERILALRDTPPPGLNRIPGPRTIRYYLTQDPELRGERLPRSTRTIWKVLVQHQRIHREARVEREPIEPAPPLQVWGVDFKDATTVPPEADGKRQHVVEILNVLDTGTSLLLESQPQDDYTAVTALRALTGTLLAQGCPQAIIMDRDPRFVGSWSGRDFPSALVRFLTCLGIEVDLCPPHRPDRNGHVERFHRTLEYECLQIHRPTTLQATAEVTAAFKTFYNEARPNQARTCGDQPPRRAFPTLPTLRPLPDQVDPDRWLRRVHGKLYQRQVKANGSVQVDKQTYYISKKLRGRRVALQVDAHQRQFVVLLAGQVVKAIPIKGLYDEVLDFDLYLELICKEAESEWKHGQHAHRPRYTT